MKGVVDSGGRFLLDVELRATHDGATSSITAWIDTGFTGELVLPQSVIEALDVPLTGTVSAVLADGSKVVMKTYQCFIQWFDELRRLEVVANEGEFPLLGVGLLLDHELQIDFRSSTVVLE